MKIKTFPFLLLLIIVFACFVLRLFWLQIIKGKENKQRADNNRVKVVKLAALRGVIEDRQGKVLGRNAPQGREYVFGEKFAHVLGYVGEVSADELSSANLKAGDIVGKMGIEKQYDAFLRGIDGGILVETDAQGKVLRQIKKIPAQAGKNLSLTLDAGLQIKAFDSLKNRKGAVVAARPNGEILALVSSPSFDPNILSQTVIKDKKSKEKKTDDGIADFSLRSEKINKIFNNPSQPMFNRAIAGLYPPGSVFKIITAIAGLEEGAINRSTLIEDTGQIKVGKFSYSNWYFTQYGKTEGMVDVVKALKRSNDIFFYKTGEYLGVVKLINWAKFFGLGQKTGIDLPGETEGLIPSPKWKKEHKLKRWYLGDTYITAIGQGDIQVTPLQVNQMTAVIANNGRFCRPHLLKSTPGNQPRGYFPGVDKFCQDLEIKVKNLELVKEGMKQACEKGGTAFPFFGFKPAVACKTGTAEYGDPQDKTHAWFTVFAPIDKPEIVLTVLLEGAGEGSYKAAPVAKEILSWWFKRKIKKE